MLETVSVLDTYGWVAICAALGGAVVYLFKDLRTTEQRLASTIQTLQDKSQAQYLELLAKNTDQWQENTKTLAELSAAIRDLAAKIH